MKSQEELLSFLEEKGINGFLSDPEKHYLYKLGFEIKKYGEIGSFKGLSAILVGLGMLESGKKNFQIFCIDTFEMTNNEKKGLDPDYTYDAFIENISKFPEIKEKIKIVRGYSDQVRSQVPDKYFDVFFIDGDHTYEGVSEDYKNYKKKLKLGGLMIFHDYSMAPGVTKLCNEIKAETKSHTISGIVIK